MKKLVIFIFFFSLIIYNLNFRIFNPLPNPDSAPSALLPFNILSGKGFYMDDFVPHVKYYFGLSFPFVNFNSHFISGYPLLPGLLSVPIYLPIFIYLKINNIADISNFVFFSFPLEKLSASIFASLSVCLFFILMWQLSKNKKISLLFSLIFAFGTQTFSISSQYLWQHGIANLFLIGSQIFLLKGKKYYIPSLILGVFSFYARPNFIIYVALLFSLICVSDRKRFLRYLGVLFVGLLLLVVFNFYLYHSIFGGYSIYANNFYIGALFNNLLGLLLSPARGLFIYTPFFFFSFISIFVMYREKRVLKNKYFFIFNYLFLILTIALYSIWNVWWAGFSWGDRFLTDVVPSAVILSYLFYISQKNLFPKIIFWGVSMYCVFIQIVGVFFYPRGNFDNYPTSIDDDPSRLWSVQDNPILRSISLGPEFTGFYRFYYLVNGIQSRQYNHEEKKCRINIENQGLFLGYKRIYILFKNESNADWVTAGENPLSLRQIFLKNGGVVAESPIGTTPFPPIIKKGMAVHVSTIVIPPKKEVDSVILTPGQEGLSLWISSCSIKVRIDP